MQCASKKKKREAPVLLLLLAVLIVRHCEQVVVPLTTWTRAIHECRPQRSHGLSPGLPSRFLCHLHRNLATNQQPGAAPFSGESLRVCAGDLYSFDVKKLFYFRTLVVPPLDILAEPVTTQFFAIISCILAGSSAAALDPDSIWLLLGSGAFRS